MAAGTGPRFGRLGRALEDEGAIAGFAADVAELIGPGDLDDLSGGLGAGKTGARARPDRILRGEQALRSKPAFTLMKGFTRA